MRELRIGSVVSAALSFLLIGISSVSALGGSAEKKETALWTVAVVAGVILAISSLLYTATEKKFVGILHGSLMALSAIAIFYVGIRCLPDRNHWRGGFVEMIQFPVAAGMILFSIATAGSALQTLLHAAKRKKPNQAPQRNAGSRSSSGDSPASETPSSLGPRG